MHTLKFTYVHDGLVTGAIRQRALYIRGRAQQNKGLLLPEQSAKEPYTSEEEHI